MNDPGKEPLHQTFPINVHSTLHARSPTNSPPNPSIPQQDSSPLVTVPLDQSLPSVDSSSVNTGQNQSNSFPTSTVPTTFGEPRQQRRRVSPNRGMGQSRRSGLPFVPSGDTSSTSSEPDGNIWNLIISIFERLAFRLVAVMGRLETEIKDRWSSISQSAPPLPTGGSHTNLSLYEQLARSIRHTKLVSSLNPDLTRRPGFIPMILCLSMLLLIFFVFFLRLLF